MSDEILHRLDKILEQTTKTNGRLIAAEEEIRSLRGDVNEMKDVVFGDEIRMTHGLLTQSFEVAALLRKWHTIERLSKWVIGLLGTVLVSLVVTLIGNL